ncbi:MAG: glycosyltransferase [Bacteroidota bacterium]
MNKKKILVFIDWFLPGYKAGGPIRSIANLTAHLSVEFEFLIITRNTDYLENNPYPTVKANQWVNFSEGINVYYFSDDKLNIKNLKKLVFSTKFDIAYINGIYSFYFSLLPVYLLKKTSKKVIVASRGMLSEHSFSSKNLKKKIFIFFVNLVRFYKNIYFHVTNDQEKIEVSKLIHRSNGFMIAPNLPPQIIDKKPAKRIKKKAILKLASIARISIEKNTLFALNILAEAGYKGKISFDLYGSVYNQKYWEECLEIINKLPDNIKVRYKGELDNQKVVETLGKYHFSFLPTLGENFGHSILESLLAGCPVIISDQTPWTGLEEKTIGWDISLNDKEKFIKTIQYCIDMEQEEYNQLSINTYKFARTFVNNPELIEQSRKLFTT